MARQKFQRQWLAFTASLNEEFCQENPLSGKSAFWIFTGMENWRNMVWVGYENNRHSQDSGY